MHLGHRWDGGPGAGCSNWVHYSATDSVQLGKGSDCCSVKLGAGDALGAALGGGSLRSCTRASTGISAGTCTRGSARVSTGRALGAPLGDTLGTTLGDARCWARHWEQHWAALGDARATGTGPGMEGSRWVHYSATSSVQTGAPDCCSEKLGAHWEMH
jgi:hypothetical protein